MAEGRAGYALGNRKLLQFCATLFGVPTHYRMLVFSVSGRNDSPPVCLTPEAKCKVPGKPAESIKKLQ